MKDNSRGLRRIVRTLQHRLQPRVPFAADMPGKGAWEALAHAPRHVWRSYRLPAALEQPITCVVLSDVHLGSQSRDLDRLDAIVGEIRARSFDVLLLPGDFINMQVFGGGRIRPGTIAEILSPLARMAPAVAVLGNHDAEYGRPHVAAALEAQGITVLFNAWTVCETQGGPLHIAGLEDHSTGEPDIAKALDGIPATASTLVLAHDPASFASVPHGPIATICGHTHGGQIRLPFFGAVVNASDAPMAWTHGHIVQHGRHLVVSAGLGSSGLPFRLNCPPEIVSLTLEPSTS